MDYAIFNVILHQTTYLNNTFPDLKIQTYPKTYYTFHRKYSTNDLCGLWVQSWPTFLSNSSLIALASLIIGSNLSRSSWSNISSATKKGTYIKNFMAPFYGWSSTVSRLQQSHYEESLLFTNKTSGHTVPHLIDLIRKDERLSQLWSQPVVFNPEPLDWE